MKNAFSCFVIGDGPLTVQCVDFLRAEGHEVRGIITSNTEVGSWARAGGLPHLDSSSNLLAVLRERPFDYLFSIVNMRILPKEIVALPRRGAINFHDGPLPRYAGVHVTSWALIHRKRTHGVTWHFMQGRVDGGQILKQQSLEISANETAFSLNTKCFEAGFKTFSELVRELADGTATPRNQDLSLRSCHGMFERPAAACVVSWERPAAEIAAFIRALEFGPVANPFGRAKVFLGGEFFFCPEVEVGAAPDGTRPGTILEAASSMRIATTEGAIGIRQLLRLDGTPAFILEIAERHDLRSGSILPAWDGDMAGRATKLNDEFCRHESFWVKQLKSLQPVSVPYINLANKAAGSETHATLELPVPESVTSFLSAQHSSWNPGEFLLVAFAVYLKRIGGEPLFDFGVCLDECNAGLAGLEGLFSTVVPLRVHIDYGNSFDDAYADIHARLDLVRQHKTFLHDMLARYPELHSVAVRGLRDLLPVRFRLVEGWEGSTANREAEMDADLCVVVPADGRQCRWVFNQAVLSQANAQLMLGQFATFLAGIVADSRSPVGDLPILNGAESRELLETRNATGTDMPSVDSKHGVFERQAGDTPDAVALVCRDQQLTYRELNARANQLARHLRKLGVGPDKLVALYVDRSIEMVVGLLGILKAGGAYVPLDPTYPTERIAFMLQDSQAVALITKQSLVSRLPVQRPQLVCLDTDWPDIAREGTDNVESGVQPHNLAYVMYTSGSTGQPKGVMIEHRNVVNCFAGIDACIGAERGVWLAVTSISFDISVLELFWTLARGFKVVLAKDDDRLAPQSSSSGRVRSARSIDFSLFYFASELGGDPRDRYRLLIEGAKYGDENGFAAVWTPERHFHSFGGLYSNPSVASAALATLTRRIGIRAGSVVSPLHHPVRLAEEWALVDNLSGGRVGISFASGWQSKDFVFAPERFAKRKSIMFEDIAMVRRLWRGETVMFRGGEDREVPVKIFPTPLQPELPVWVTAAGNPETFRQAGEIGANVLTHLLGQKIEDVEQKIRIYREARAGAGFLGRGQVTLMLHTYVGETMEAVKAAVRDPMCRYLGTSLDLIRDAPFAFPTFKLPSESIADKVKQGLNSFSPEDMNALLGFAFERYFETSGLFGTVERCLEMVERCKMGDVDEIGCLIDYGVPVEQALEGLRALNEVRIRSNHPAPVPVAEEDYSLLAQIKAHGVTHLQCTPSLARILADQPGGVETLAGLKRLLLGGEALPQDLVSRLRKVVRGEIHNMYGPTETTIWSTTGRLPDEEDFITIGRPMVNTQVYVVDRHLRLLPIGIPGELLIGGDGVSRGYLNREELTRERFIPDTFSKVAGRRLYRTGDLAAWRPDGRIDFLGRLDQQVKIRGHRIELGEIEHALTRHTAVTSAAVVSRVRTNGEAELIAYYLTSAGASVEAPEFRDMLAPLLPDYMIPRAFIRLDKLPTTPNGKIDRKALANMPVTTETVRRSSDAAPASDLEKSIASVFAEALELNGMGVDENFFDLGANSLTMVRVASKLREMFPGRVGLVDLFQHTTIQSLASFLSDSSARMEDGATRGGNRGRQRREALLAKRRN